MEERRRLPAHGLLSTADAVLRKGLVGRAEIEETNV